MATIVSIRQRKEPLHGEILPLLCKDCKWFKKQFLVPANLGECHHPTITNLVTGKRVPRMEAASNNRHFDHEPEFCGPSGKFWERR